MSITENIGEEQALLIKLRAGDYLAFETIYHRYKGPLAVAMLRLLKSPELVEDLLQELFVRLWEHRATIEPDRLIKPYLFRVAQNLVYDTFRKASKNKRMLERLLGSIEAYCFDTERRIIANEERQLIESVLAMLPPKRREVYMLCKLESKSYEEVSKLLHISLSTINDHMYKANLFLKEYFMNNPASFLPLLLAACMISGL